MLDIVLALTGAAGSAVDSTPGFTAPSSSARLAGSNEVDSPLTSTSCGSALGSDAYCSVKLLPGFASCKIDINVADDRSELGAGAMLAVVVEALEDVAELVV